jgi:uncharacterized Zn finger protein
MPIKCPACGDKERQERVGQLATKSHVLYRCAVCQHLYASFENEDDDKADTEDQGAGDV